MTEDQDAQIKTKVKRLRSRTNICHHILSMHEDIKPESCFQYEGLALQDYNNKAHDSELATVPRKLA